MLLATVTVQQRSLDNPDCKVKSYINGQIYTFIGVIDKETGKNYDSIAKLAADFGSDWDGHRLECKGDSQNHQLINHLGEIVFWSNDLTKRQAPSSGATNNNSNNGKTTEASDSNSDVQKEKTNKQNGNGQGGASKGNESKDIGQKGKNEDGSATLKGFSQEGKAKNKEGYFGEKKVDGHSKNTTKMRTFS